MPIHPVFKNKYEHYGCAKCGYDKTTIYDDDDTPNEELTCDNCGKFSLDIPDDRPGNIRKD